VLMCCHHANFSDIAFDAIAYEIIVWRNVRDLRKALVAKLNSLLSHKIIVF